MTRYVILRERPAGVVEKNEGGSVTYTVAGEREAANAEQACRMVGDTLADSALDEGDGVTLVAVPTRNWTSGRNTFKAETRRRLLRSP